MHTLASTRRSRVGGTRRIDDTDRIIAMRLRLARIEAGLTQTELGDAIGVSFQQIQKYERGMNRLTASGLLRLAAVLKRDIGYFFTASGNPCAQVLERAATETLDSVRRLDLDIVRQLVRIEDDRLKRGILALLSSCGEPSASADVSAPTDTARRSR